MTSKGTQLSPQFHAKPAGLCWLATILTSVFALSVSSRLLPLRDAVITATNLVAHGTLLRAYVGRQ
ncbi:MAG: hypothetical protein PSV13_14935 [Lacunisphaera sp.]|nr:hypothetical protein [Lacunisphaera sp.]